MASMPSLAAWLRALQRGYMQVIQAMAATLMAAILVIMSAQVFYRYFLTDPLIWAEEISRYLLIWMSFLAAGAAFQRGDMAVLAMLTSVMSRRLRALVMVPSYVITAGFLGVLVYHGWSYAEENLIQAIPAVDFISQSLIGRDSGVSMFLVYVSVPIGCALLALHFIASAVRVATEAFARPGGTPADG